MCRHTAQHPHLAGKHGHCHHHDRPDEHPQAEQLRVSCKAGAEGVVHQADVAASSNQSDVGSNGCIGGSGGGGEG
jgi:hypothetical protein